MARSLFVSNCLLWFTLRRLASDELPDRRRAAVSLSESPCRRALAALSAAVHDDDVEVRRHAVTALGKLDDPLRIAPLLEAFSDSNEEVHAAAAQALASSRDTGLIVSLVERLSDTDPLMRQRSAALLERLDWTPSGSGEEILFAVARGLFARAAAFGAEAIDALVMAIQTAQPNLRPAVVEALGRVADPRVLPAILEALHSGNASLSMAAVRALGLLALPEAFDPVAALREHEDGRVRLVVVMNLSRIDSARSTAPLVESLHDHAWDVRRAAAEALGRLNNVAAVEALVSALGDMDADVRETAAISLGDLHDRRAIGPLVMALKDPTSGVRRIASRALRVIDEHWEDSTEARTAVEELKLAMHDKNPDVRYAVAKLLQSFGIIPPETIRYLPELSYYYELQQSLGALASRNANLAPEVLSVTDLEKRRKLATTLMMASLCDADSDFRRAAAMALGRLGDPRAEGALRRALQDSNPGVRQVVENSVQALGQVRRTIGRSTPTNSVSSQEQGSSNEPRSPQPAAGQLRLA